MEFYTWKFINNLGIIQHTSKYVIWIGAKFEYDCVLQNIVHMCSCWGVRDLEAYEGRVRRYVAGGGS